MNHPNAPLVSAIVRSMDRESLSQALQSLADQQTHLLPTQDADRDFIADTLPVFISEAQEQIAELEQLLLQLEDAPGDRDLLDALFRCAHTVKGSAGIFGLDDVVAFTHHVETLLDRLREGALTLDPALSTLLLQGGTLFPLVKLLGLRDDGTTAQELRSANAQVEYLLREALAIAREGAPPDLPPLPGRPARPAAPFSASTAARSASAASTCRPGASASAKVASAR